MKQSISMLLGAGFSKPKGYPLGIELDNSLMTCTGDEFAFHTDGTLIYNNDTSPVKRNYLNSFDRQFYFCRALIKFYDEEVNKFNYEEFYDFIVTKAAQDERVKKIAIPFMGGYGSITQLLSALENIYSQLIDYYLIDSNRKTWYDDSNFHFGLSYDGYEGILKCLTYLSENYILDIHTLNHVLFFESLNSFESLSDQICDGFQEIGSPYFGKLNSRGRIYMVRLSRFTNSYDKNIRLYKLHGSRDYVPYFTDKDGIGRPENYLKLRFGVGPGDLYKEKSIKNGSREYEHCFINYHGDIMIGTTTKILRYKEPLIYKKLFKYFNRNLIEADKLIIVGYGGRDLEINKIIKKRFDYHSKKIIIIDPFPSDTLQALSSDINAHIIEKSLNDVLIDDIIF